MSNAHPFVRQGLTLASGASHRPGIVTAPFNPPPPP
jgi:hypothetical protein